MTETERLKEEVEFWKQRELRAVTALGRALCRHQELIDEVERLTKINRMLMVGQMQDGGSK